MLRKVNPVASVLDSTLCYFAPAHAIFSSKIIRSFPFTLSSLRLQVNEYKGEIDRLTRELHDMKCKFYEQKRREAMAKEKEMKLFSGENRLSSPERQARQQAVEAAASKTRYTGGGFAIK